MNKQDLDERLKKEKYYSCFYSLDGLPHEQGYCLELREGAWCTFYFERGDISNLTEFDNEDVACEDLYHKIAADPYMKEQKWLP